jgi:serine protease AprX
MRDSRGFRQGFRSNALWGSRPGKRGNALWGNRGGRSIVLLTVCAALTLVLPLAAGAKGGRPGGSDSSFISPGLVEKAAQDPGRKLHVIIQSASGTSDAKEKIVGLGAEVRKTLDLIGAVAVDIPAGKLAALAKQPGLVITPDASVQLTATPSSGQMWPYETGLAKLWGTATSPGPQAPTIAIVDSGIEANRSDFGSRVLGNINLTTLAPNSPGDGRGHGTFVASIAAGAADGYTGSAPNAAILSVDVMDDAGKARTSDVIAACEFILASKGKYNIRVANFSLHSAAKNHFYHDPLDQAVEKLWFNGIFVVAAAGNYGSSSGPSGVLHAPGSDPFIMTVGAVDIGTKVAVGDDANTPWSAYGYTEDGFSKPELGAPGRYMVGAAPAGSTLVAEKPGSVVKPGYMELSGTSFAAPVVAGAAAQLIARHPDWTPDMVKGALMVTAKPVPQAAPGAVGVGQLNAGKAGELKGTPPNGNLPLLSFLTSSGSGGLSFDSASWASAVTANASWAAASWADASWAAASWSAASWADASWSAASWADASWADASWAQASWADSATEDGADGDVEGEPALLSASALLELQRDPDLALPAVLLPTITTP